MGKVRRVWDTGCEFTKDCEELHQVLVHNKQVYVRVPPAPQRRTGGKKLTACRAFAQSLGIPEAEYTLFKQLYAEKNAKSPLVVLYEKALKRYSIVLVWPAVEPSVLATFAPLASSDARYQKLRKSSWLKYFLIVSVSSILLFGVLNYWVNRDTERWCSTCHTMYPLYEEHSTKCPVCKTQFTLPPASSALHFIIYPDSNIVKRIVGEDGEVFAYLRERTNVRGAIYRWETDKNNCKREWKLPFTRCGMKSALSTTRKAIQEEENRGGRFRARVPR